MRVPSQQEFLSTPAGVHARRELQAMVLNSSYRTDGSYDFPLGGGLTFEQRHLNYLVKHPYVSPVAYISNLKVMTKIKR
jgi:hypothetical protein